jgi:hypothetical protein
MKQILLHKHQFEFSRRRNIPMVRIRILSIVALLGLIGMALALLPSDGQAASHREAPLIAQDPTADITDFFMFRSYEAGNADNVVLIMDVIPGEEPSSGPNYWNFDPNVLYTLNIDNDADGQADDVKFEFQFKNEIRGPVKDLGLFLSYVAVPGPITKLDGAGSEGLGLRQKYSVTMVRNDRRRKLADGLIAVPSNVGPRTMPNYDNLAAQGIYQRGDMRVFAGQREDPFYIDLGGVFDTLNLRRNPPLLSTAEDANDNSNPFGVDMLSGFNVHSIALEVPASWLTKDGKGPAATAFPKLGAYASTSRQKTRVLRGDGTSQDQDSWIQVQRLANPLVNETIIGTIDKDRWNAAEPEQESQFLDYYLNPRLALALQLVFGVPAGTSGRTDLRDLLLKYQPSDTRLSELLRLNISVPPTLLASQKRLGPLAHDAGGASTPDPAAWPNGRRPIDDVTDVAVRVVGGSNYINAMAGDGVNRDDAALPNSFPFLSRPFDGRNRVHANP